MGYAAQVITIYGCMTYIVILVWAFLYLFSSFTADLPWANCNNAWNTGIYNIVDLTEIWCRGGLLCAYVSTETDPSWLRGPH